MFLSIITALLSLTESRQVHNYAEINCFIKHLKSVGKLEADYPEFNVAKQVQNCENVMKVFQKEVYKKVALAQKLDFEEHSKCIMNDLRSQNWVDHIMIQGVVLASDTLSDVEKTAKVEEIETVVKQIVADAINFCVNQKEFGELFDAFFINDSSNEEEDDQIAEYCGRKYVIDKNLIDSAVYDVVLNPKNLEVSTVDCEENNKKLFKLLNDLIEEILKKDEHVGLNAIQIQCAMKKYHENNFIDKLIRIAVISECNVTEEQKLSERKAFIKFMSETISTLMDCE